MTRLFPLAHSLRTLVRRTHAPPPNGTAFSARMGLPLPDVVSLLQTAIAALHVASGAERDNRRSTHILSSLHANHGDQNSLKSEEQRMEKKCHFERVFPCNL